LLLANLVDGFGRIQQQFAGVADADIRQKLGETFERA
jgi:hypothetical protein